MNNGLLGVIVIPYTHSSCECYISGGKQRSRGKLNVFQIKLDELGVDEVGMDELVLGRSVCGRSDGRPSQFCAWRTGGIIMSP